MSTDDTNATRRGSESKDLLGPMPTSAEDEAVVLARLSKTPAEAYERGYMDGAARERKRLRALLAESHDFWAHYSCLTESYQDDMRAERDAMLAKMKNP